MLMMEEVSAEHFNDEGKVIKKVECPMKSLTKGNVFIKISRQVMLKYYSKSPKC